MTTVLYAHRGFIWNDVYASEAAALDSFGLYFEATVLDVFPGTVTGREMRRLAKTHGCKVGR